MSGIAGKIMPRPRGAYDSTATYDILDMVTLNNKLWIAKKTGIQNTEPTTETDENWMLCVEGGTSDGGSSSSSTKQIDTTILSANWVGDGTPYTNTITVDGVTETNIVDVVLPDSLTSEQITAYQEAQILNGSQAEGSITLNCWGVVPLIDLPVTVIIRG